MVILFVLWCMIWGLIGFMSVKTIMYKRQQKRISDYMVNNLMYNTRWYNMQPKIEIDESE